MKKYRDGGIYTADMGQPPQDIDGGSAPPKKPMPAPKKPMSAPKKIRGEGMRNIPVPQKPAKEPKMAKGGSIDGIAKRGRTHCKTV